MKTISTWQRLCPSPMLSDPVLGAIEQELERPETQDQLRNCELEETYPKEIIARLKSAGLPALFAGQTEEAAADPAINAYRLNALNEMTARRSGSLAIILGVNSLALLPAYIAGTPEQLRHIFARVRGGALAAMLLTEWDVGSDLLNNRTRAEPGTVDGQGRFRPAARDEPATHFRIHGEKHLINGGNSADLLFTFARTGTPPDDRQSAFAGAAAFSLILVERDSSVQALPRYRTLPGAAADISGIRFSGTVVPAANVLAGVGEGYRLVQETLSISRGGISSLAAGATHHAYRSAVDYARQRVLYGAPILQLGGVMDHLVQLAALDLSVSCLSLKSAALVNAVGTAAAHYTAVAKLACCRLAEEAVDEGRQVLAARALVTGTPYERLVRDVLLYAVFDGTSHIMMEQIQWRLAQMAGRSTVGGQSSSLSELRRVYHEPPQSLVQAARSRRRPMLFSIEQHARALADLPGECRLEPIVQLAAGVLQVVRVLRDRGDWSQDQGLRFELAGILALTEALLATVELADPDRRPAVAPPELVEEKSGLCPTEPAYRFGLSWIGSRTVTALTQLARRFNVPLDLTDAERELAKPYQAARTDVRSNLVGEE